MKRLGILEVIQIMLILLRIIDISVFHSFSAVLESCAILVHGLAWYWLWSPLFLSIVLQIILSALIRNYKYDYKSTLKKLMLKSQNNRGIE